MYVFVCGRGGGGVREKGYVCVCLWKGGEGEGICLWKGGEGEGICVCGRGG